MCGTLSAGHSLLAACAPQTSTVEPQSPGLEPAADALRPFDELMQEFIEAHSVPGVALAVGRKGQLIYEKGFGFADVEAQTPVTPQSQFRIASISKPITAVAILKLVEKGSLNLDSTIGDLFTAPEYPPPIRDEIKSITIRQLLNHTAGFDREVSFDPMFRLGQIGNELGLKRIATRDELMAYMFNRPLDFTPGERYAYSNFGYCVLGRVIERVSGQPYAQFVAEQVLQPLEMHSTSLGRSALQFRQPSEVKYYLSSPRSVTGIAPGVEGEPVSVQYGGWVLENMDSHGGWIATAGDLVRFANAFDDPENCPLLSSQTIQAMFARPEGNEGDWYYGLGWNVRPVKGGVNHWHTGSLDGTSTLLVHRSDGLSWAVLFNARSTADQEALAGKIDSLMHAAAAKVRTWPKPSR